MRLRIVPFLSRSSSVERAWCAAMIVAHPFDVEMAASV